MEQLNFYCCSFCYKNVDEGELEKHEMDEILSKFIKAVKKYFGRGKSGDLLKLESCPDCLTIVSSFCDLFHHLKCLELEVDWRLSRLKNVMSGADNVVFRKENFRRSWRKSGGDGREVVEEFRKDFITKCGSLSKNSFPRVVLYKRPIKIEQKQLDKILNNPQSIIPLLEGGGCITGEGMMMMDSVLVKNELGPGRAPFEHNVDTQEQVMQDPASDKCASNLVISEVRSLVAVNSPPGKNQVPVAPALPPPTVKQTSIVVATIPEDPMAVNNAVLEVEDTPMEVDDDDVSSQLSTTLKTPVPPPISTPVPETVIQMDPVSTHPDLPAPTRNLRPRKQSAMMKTPQIIEEDTESEEEDKAESIKENDDDDDYNGDVNISEVESDDDYINDYVNEAPDPLPSPRPPPPIFKSVEGSSVNSHLDNVNVKCKVKRAINEPSTNQSPLILPRLKQKCDTCYRMYETKKELAAHQNLHGSFTCSRTTCDFTETYAPNLAEHELKHSSDTMVFENEDASDAGAKANASTTRGKGSGRKMGKGCHAINCPRCPEKFSRLRAYFLHFVEVHLDLHSLKEINRCPVCKSCFIPTSSTNLFHSRRQRAKHIKEQHDIEGMDPSSVVRCEHCPAYFRRHRQLFTHNKRMHEGNMLKCWECGSKQSNSYTLRHHRIEVHNLNPADFKFVCDISACQERYETARDLEAHKSARHNKYFKEGSDKMICTECGKVCTGPLGLKGHMKIHSEGFAEKVLMNKKKKTLICEYCGKAHADNFRLQQHKLVVHLGPEHWKFECEVCGKKCFSKNKLDEHARVHLKTKPFVCDVCGVSYAHAHNLRIHKNKKHQGGEEDNNTKKEEQDDDDDL